MDEDRNEMGQFIKGHKSGMSGKKHSDKTRKKQSIAREGWIPSEEVKSKRLQTIKDRYGKLKGWNRVYNDGEKYISTKTKNKKYLHHIVWCKENNIHRIPDGCIIHHINRDTSNNSPENLQLMTQDFHLRLHNEFFKQVISKELAQ